LIHAAFYRVNLAVTIVSIGDGPSCVKLSRRFCS